MAERINKTGLGGLHGRSRGSVWMHDAWCQLHGAAWRKRPGAIDPTTRDGMHAWDQRGAARTKSKVPAPNRELEANPGWRGRGGWTQVTQIRKKVHAGSARKGRSGGGIANNRVC